MACVVSQLPATADLLSLYSTLLDLSLEPKHPYASVGCSHKNNPPKVSRHLKQGEENRVNLRTCPWDFRLWPGDS